VVSVHLGQRRAMDNWRNRAGESIFAWIAIVAPVANQSAQS
jgi:hypothetical protein